MKFTILQAREALIESGGKVRPAARVLGVSLPTLQQRMKLFPILQEIREAVQSGESPPEILDESAVVRVHWKHPKEVDPEQAWYALIRSMGVISRAARSLGVYPASVRNTIKAYPDLQILMTQIELAKVEDLEAMHYERAFTDKNPASRIHWLETQKPGKWLRQKVSWKIQLTDKEAGKLFADKERFTNDQLREIRGGNFQLLESRAASSNSRVGTAETRELPAKSN